MLTVQPNDDSTFSCINSRFQPRQVWIIRTPNLNRTTLDRIRRFRSQRRQEALAINAELEPSSFVRVREMVRLEEGWKEVHDSECCSGTVDGRDRTVVRLNVEVEVFTESGQARQGTNELW